MFKTEKANRMIRVSEKHTSVVFFMNTLKASYQMTKLKIFLRTIFNIQVDKTETDKNTLALFNAKI